MRRGQNEAQIVAAQRKRTLVSAAIIFLGIPLAIFLGVTLLNDRQYTLVSWLILGMCIAPFFMVFERRKPKAREIVLIAMMSALTICTQLVSRMTVGVAAGTGLIILCGISLGPEAGFLIGALSRFVLNFYEGQGPWTPWQMFCWGLLGFLAGLVFNRANVEKLKSRDFKVVMGPVLCVVFAILVAYLTYLFFPDDGGGFMGWRLYVFGAVGLLAGVLLQRKRLPVDWITLSIFTFFGVFIIYGGLMNICAMVTAASIPGADAIGWGTMKGLYITGVPYDAYHAFTAALFNLIFGNSVIKKLERVKLKYGIYR